MAITLTLPTMLILAAIAIIVGVFLAMRWIVEKIYALVVLGVAFTMTGGFTGIGAWLDPVGWEATLAPVRPLLDRPWPWTG